MDPSEVTKTLKAIGWRIHTDEVGDKVALFDLPDRMISIIYGVRTLSDHQQLESTLSVSTEVFSNACLSVRPEFGANAPLISNRKGLKVIAPEIQEEHVRQASEEAIGWAQEQDLDQAIKEKAALPTDAPGTGPILHLAALVVSGDIDRLKYYQSSLEAGDRLGFVPYVTKDYIDRAVAYADQNAAGGQSVDS